MQYDISTRRELLEMLPTRSWIGIRTIASEMGLRRSRDDTPNEFPYDICLADWQAIKVHGLVIAVDRNNLLVRSQQEETTTKSPNAVPGNCVQSWRQPLTDDTSFHIDAMIADLRRIIGYHAIVKEKEC